MGHPPTAAELTRRLAEHHRVMVLGGLAVIGHGQSRSTYDSDLWLDPTLPLQDWCEAIHGLSMVPGPVSVVCMGSWREIGPEEIAGVIQRDRVVRISGASQPIDIFREPNELDMGLFDEVWGRARPLGDGTRLPDAIDLLATKQMTGRDKDLADITFLERKAEADYLARLPGASASEALAMLARFLTPRVAEAALDHADASVSALGMRFLRELAGEGDPFAEEILRRREMHEADG